MREETAGVWKLVRPHTAHINCMINFSTCLPCSFTWNSNIIFIRSKIDLGKADRQLGRFSSKATLTGSVKVCPGQIPLHYQILHDSVLSLAMYCAQVI